MDGGGRSSRKRKGAKHRKAEGRDDGLLWIFSRVFPLSRRLTRVSLDLRRIQAPAFFCPRTCFGMASGIELERIHYAVAMETEAQMLIKCVRGSPNKRDDTGRIPSALTAKASASVFTMKGATLDSEYINRLQERDAVTRALQIGCQLKKGWTNNLSLSLVEMVIATKARACSIRGGNKSWRWTKRDGRHGVTWI